MYFASIWFVVAGELGIPTVLCVVCRCSVHDSTHLQEILLALPPTLLRFVVKFVPKNGLEYEDLAGIMTLGI